MENLILTHRIMACVMLKGPWSTEAWWCSFGDHFGHHFGHHFGDHFGDHRRSDRRSDRRSATSDIISDNTSEIIAEVIAEVISEVISEVMMSEVALRRSLRRWSPKWSPKWCPKWSPKLHHQASVLKAWPWHLVYLTRGGKISKKDFSSISFFMVSRCRTVFRDPLAWHGPDDERHGKEKGSTWACTAVTREFSRYILQCYREENKIWFPHRSLLFLIPLDVTHNKKSMLRY